MPTMNAAEIEAFLQDHFPQIKRLNLVLEEVTDKTMRARLPQHHTSLRPEGTVSGPTLMLLADVLSYLQVIAASGPIVGCVTTNLNISFLRMPAHRDVIGQTDLLKLGARLAVVAVTLYSDGFDEPVAHATVTYAIPREKRRD